MIQCAKKCVHQKEGYCTLSGSFSVTNTVGECPHYKCSDTCANSVQKFNGITDGADIDKFNTVG